MRGTRNDTGAAVILDGRRIFSNRLLKFPSIRNTEELSRSWPPRRHIEPIVPIVTEALKRAGITLREIGIAVTQGPGLVGSLLVGLSFSKSVAFAFYDLKNRHPWITSSNANLQAAGRQLR